MLAKEFFDLKPGTFIKGLCLVPRYVSSVPYDRFATPRPEGWVYYEHDPKPNQIITPFFESHLPEVFKSCLTGPQAQEVLQSADSNWPFDGEEEQPPPFLKSPLFAFHAINTGEPVGVHLGCFILSLTRYSPVHMLSSGKNYLVYSKILLGTGETGYIMLSTPDVHRTELSLS